MQEDRISRFYDLNNIKVESEFVLEYLTKVLQLIREINVAKDQMERAGTFKIIADSVSRVKQAVDDTTAATTKLADATAKAAQKQVDAYSQLKNQYADAIRNAQNLAAQFGAQSDQALKAAAAADIYRQRLEQIKNLVNSGGKQAAIFDPNSVPFENKTGGGGEAAKVQDYRTTEAAIDEMRAHVDSLTEAYERLSISEKEGAAGQSLLAEINSLNAAYDDAVLHYSGFTKAAVESGEAIKKSALPVEDVKLKYDQYTGTLQENIAMQQKYAQQLSENKDAQNAIGGTTDEEIVRLNQLKQEELELTAANRELSLTIRNQVKEYQSAEGSIDQMQAQIALLKQSYEGLSAAEKESAFGQGMLTQVQALDSAVKASEKQIGNAQRNVGNYAEAFTQAGNKIVTFVTRDLFRAVAGFLVFQLAFEAVSKLGEALWDWFQKVTMATGAMRTLQLQTEAWREVQAAAADSYGQESAQLEILVQKLRDEKISRSEKMQTLDELHQKYPGYFDDIKNEGDLTDKLASAYKRAAQGILLKAQAAAAQDAISKKTAEIFQAEIDLQNKQADNAKIQQMIITDYTQKGMIDRAEKTKQQTKLLNQQFQDEYLQTVGPLNEQVDFLLKKALDADEQIDKLGGKTKKAGKDPSKDYAADLYKQQDEERKAIFDAQQKELEGKVKYDHDIVDSDKHSFSERLDATQAFYDNSLKLLTNARDFELNEVDKQTDEARRKVDRELQNTKLTSAQRQTLQDTLKAIDEKAAAERAKIQEDFNLKVYVLNDSSEKQITALVEDNNKKRAAYAKDAAQKMYDAVAGEVQASQGGAEKAEAQLDKLYASGKLSKQQYEEAKYKIESDLRVKSLQDWIDYYQYILSFVNLDKQTRENAEKELDKLRKQLHDEHKKDHQKDAQDERADYDARLQRLQQLGDALKNTASTFLGAAIDKQKNAVQDQINAIDKLTQKEIDAVNSSVASQQDKAARIAIIETQAQNQKDILAARQKQLDEQKAKFDRLSSIISVIESTAKAVTSDLKDHKELVPYDYAIGAAQLAAILAQPIPHYARGTKDHPGGLAVVGDGGRSELVVTPGGDLLKTPSSSTLVDLPEHSIVLPQLPSAETMAMWATRGAMGAMSGRRPGADPVAASISKMERNVVSAVKNIPQPFIKVEGQVTKWVRSKNSWFNDLKN